jgi:concentrative nucleoside transporter, CNT family
LTLELILGYICYPIAFLLGVSREGNDLLLVGRLIGLKLIVVSSVFGCSKRRQQDKEREGLLTNAQNEFFAFTLLSTDPAYQSLSPRSTLIATYALCGFANLGSLGTQIGVLSQLCPRRSADVSRVAFSALITGAISTLSSACIAGLLIQDQAALTSTA